MAARGSIAKEEVMNKILATFPGAFKYEKELRIPMVENGEELQIKVTLTAAKNMVAAGGDTAIPGAKAMEIASQNTAQSYANIGSPVGYEPATPTAEEKKNVSNLIELLGL
jgi:hypothetical protein